MSKLNYKKIISNNWAVIIVVFWLIASALFVCFHWNSIWVFPNDTLDSNVAYMQFTHLKWKQGTDISQIESPICAGDASTERLFQYGFLSYLNFIRVLYLLLGAKMAYISSYFIRMVLSVVGWFYLVRTMHQGMMDRWNRNISIAIGFLYVLSSCWPMTMATAALPLVFSLFVATYKSKSFRQMITLMISEFAVLMISGCGLALFGIFILGYIFLAFIYSVIRNKRIDYRIIGIGGDFNILCIMGTPHD